MEKTYPITVDYSKTLVEMIEAGNYDWINSGITDEHFPIKRRKKSINIELINYNTGMRSNEVLEDLGKRGLRPATLPELLAFGTAYPDRQRDVPIVALGSVWWCESNWSYSAGLGHDNRGRVLDLESWNAKWRSSVRFAAVRK